MAFASSLKCLEVIGISIIALNHKTISNDASHGKYIDNVIFVLLLVLVLSRKKKKSGMTKRRHC